MNILDKVEQYINEKKDEKRLKGITNRLKDDPHNIKVLAKLTELYDERERLKAALHNRELEIDACIFLLYYNDNKV
jgi:hypothetical protein